MLQFFCFIEILISTLQTWQVFMAVNISDICTIISKTEKVSRMGLNLDCCLHTKFSYFKWFFKWYVTELVEPTIMPSDVNVPLLLVQWLNRSIGWWDVFWLQAYIFDLLLWAGYYGSETEQLMKSC
jgi:hypothetical protein